MTATTENQNEGRNRRSIRNYLINRRFQLRWISSILVLSMLIFITLGAYIYLSGTYQTEAAEQLRESCLSQLGYEAEELKGVIDVPNQAHDQTVVWVLALSGAFLVLLLAGLAIRQTHRVAGPIYALCQFMGKVTKGNFIVPRALRKGDHFQEAGHALRDLVQSLRDKEEAELGILTDVHGSDGLSDAAKSQLAELIEKKRSRLG